MLVAHNTNGSNITSAELSFLSPFGTVTSITRKPVLPTRGDLIWTAQISGIEEETDRGTLIAELRYTASGSNQISSIAIGTMTIIQASEFNLADAVRSTLIPRDGAIDQFTPLGLVLELQNPSRYSILIDNIHVLSPPYAKLSANFKHRHILSSGNSLGIPLRIETTDVVVPGTYELVLAYSLHVEGRQS